MNALRFILPAALGVGVLAASLVLSSAPSVLTQETPPGQLPPGPIKVEVVNGQAINTMVVGGSVDANIGVPPVTIDDPNIHPSRIALPVVDIREAAKKPFAYWAPFEFENRADGRVLWTERQTAPVDQFIVLEYVNVEACSQPGEKISVNLYVTYDYGAGQKGERALKILMTEQGVFMEDEGAYLHLGSSQQMKIYIQPGQQYWFQVWRQGDAHFRVRGHAEGAAWMSGYLVPAVQAGPGR